MVAFKCFLTGGPFHSALSLTGIASSGTVNILIQGFLIVCFGLSFFSTTDSTFRFLSHIISELIVNESSIEVF